MGTKIVIMFWYGSIKCHTSKEWYNDQQIYQWSLWKCTIQVHMITKTKSLCKRLTVIKLHVINHRVVAPLCCVHTIWTFGMYLYELFLKKIWICSFLHYIIDHVSSLSLFPLINSWMITMRSWPSNGSRTIHVKHFNHCK